MVLFHKPTKQALLLFTLLRCFVFLVLLLALLSTFSSSDHVYRGQEYLCLHHMPTSFESRP